MNVKRKQEEAKRTLAIFFPRCTKNYPINECSLSVIEVFLVCEENHTTDKYHSLHGLKDEYQGGEVGPDQLCFIQQRRPQSLRSYKHGVQGAPYSYYHNNKSAPMQPWYTPTPPSWPTPPTWPYNPPYHPKLMYQQFQLYVPQKYKWNNPSQ